MDSQTLASQLKTPHGNEGIKVGKMMNTGNALMYELTLNQIDFKSTKNILEIGFGNGAHIPQLVSENRGIYYSGVDYSQLMVDEAKTAIVENQLESQVEIHKGNISKLPYQNNLFDTIFTINTLYFWQYPLNDAQEVYRVLKPGGVFLLSFRPKEMAEKLSFTSFGFNLYSLEEAKVLLSNAGFSNLESFYQEGPTSSINGSSITFSSYCLKALK